MKLFVENKRSSPGFGKKQLVGRAGFEPATLRFLRCTPDRLTCVHLCVYGLVVGVYSVSVYYACGSGLGSSTKLSYRPTKNNRNHPTKLSISHLTSTLNRHCDKVYLITARLDIVGNAINKKRVLIGLLVPFTLMILSLLYLSLVYPFVTEAFTLAPAETATRELNLQSDERAYIGLTTIGWWSSGRSAMDWVIRFYVTDPNNHVILDQTGIAGMGLFYPLTFIAQESGTYTMHFENNVGGQFEKTVDLYYKISPAIFGIPIEFMLLIIVVISGAFIIAIATMVLVLKPRPSKMSNPKS